MPAVPTPEEIWHYLANQFDNVTKGRRKRMNAILLDAFTKLTEGVPGNAALAPILAVLTAAKPLWDAAYGSWKERRAAWRSTTQEMLNLLTALQVSPGGGARSKIDKWESKVAAFWASSHGVYAYLFPQGREPFTVGARDEIILEVKGLGERLTSKSGELEDAAAVPGLPAAQAEELQEQADAIGVLGTEVTAFYNLMKAARTAQTAKEGLVDQAAALCEQRRVQSATALYRVLAKLMDHFAEPEVRMQIAGFFDLSLIVSPPDDDDEEEEEELPEPPGSPQNPAIVTGAVGSGLLSFTVEPLEGADGYKPRRGETVLGTFTTLPIELTFDPGEEVTLTMVAFNEGGDSPPSGPVTGNAG